MLHHQLTSANDSVGCLNRCLHVPTAVQLLRCEGQTPLEMNLYRSFGNLMEAWMTEGTVYSDSNSLGNSEDSPTPSSDMETNLRSESVDSGVETASSDTSFHATSYSVSADNAEIDAFVPEGEGERLIQTSTSQSPALSSPVPSSCSSSSPHFCPRRPQGGPGTVHLKVEQALQRTYFKHQRDNPLPLTVEDRLRRQPQASFLPQRHTMDLVRGQRSQSFSPGRTANSSVPIRPMSKMCRRPMSMNYDRNRLEVRCSLCKPKPKNKLFKFQIISDSVSWKARGDETVCSHLFHQFQNYIISFTLTCIVLQSNCCETWIKVPEV